MKKRFLALLLALVMALAILPATALAAQEFVAADFASSSWFGQYTGTHDTNNGIIYLERYIDFTIDVCDSAGNFTGSAKVTTVEGQGYDYLWMNYDMAGKIDFGTNSFHMQGTKITSKNSGTTWKMFPFDGTIQIDANGDMRISGIVNNREDLPFSFSRTSRWARSEMTEANILGLIPEAMRGADMSKPITRAEFAAVSVNLYEAMTGGKASGVSTPFTDIAGNTYQADIEKAYGLNIINGTSAGEFAPDVILNREQLATMLCRTVKKYAFEGWTLETDGDYYLDTTGVALFADDADISDFAKPSVYYMVKMKIINGKDATHFGPKNMTTEQEAVNYATATREQAVALALRIYKNIDLWK